MRLIFGQMKQRERDTTSLLGPLRYHVDDENDDDGGDARDCYG